MSDQQYDNTNKIVIFVNNRPDRKANSPIMTGKVNVEGVDYKVSLWARESQKDKSTFWSGQIQKAEDMQTNAGGLPPGATPPASTGPVSPEPPAPSEPVNVGDDIPF